MKLPYNLRRKLASERIRIMPRRYVALTLLLTALISAPLILAQQPSLTPSTPASTIAADPNDPIARIREEGLKRSHVMETLSYLSDVIGPRLTGSPNMKRANDWTRDQLAKWGLQNAHLESWGPFGRSWVLKSFSAEVIEPQAIPLIAYPKAWSPGADVSLADVVYFDAKDEADFARFKGQLRGIIVLAGWTSEVGAHFEPEGTRLSEKELLALADAGSPDAERGPS